MKKSKCSFIKIVFSFPLLGFSQSTEQQMISSSGNYFANGDAQLSYTIGETIITTVSNSSNTLTQGFHQSNWNFVGIEDYFQKVEINVFPNPFVDELTIKAENYQNLTYQLIDAMGKLVQEGKLEGLITQIRTKNLTPSTYSLVIQDIEQINLKKFKLIKTH